MWVCIGGGPLQPYLSDHDASDTHTGVVCTRVGDLAGDARTAYILARALRWLLSL